MSSITIEQPTRLVEAADTAPATADEYIIAQPGEPIVNITAFTARQKASGYVGDQISHLMGGGAPTLILARGRLVWRVPIIFTRPSQGIIGTVGELDVDARTGRLIVPPHFVEQAQVRAKALIA